MKELEMRKDDFINMASHELRTPITSAKIYTQFLKEHLRELHDEKAATTLNKLDKQIDKLTGLIFQLLDINRMQVGKLTYDKQLFNFDSLVKETVGLQQLMSKKHKIVIKGKTGKKIYGDKERIGQVLTNLLSNAVKYSQESDKIIVDLNSDGKDIKVAVQDFGLGVPKAYHKKIFERFFRVYDNRDKTYPGLGMGLYIALEIIKNHNGKLWVASDEGAGSIFYFTLPLKESIDE